MEILIRFLLWFSAIGCGLMAGIYFAFSTFIVTALDRVPTSSGMFAMQSINTVIVRSLFLPLFFGTTLSSGALAGIALDRLDEPGALEMLAGGLIYVVGMFLCTMVFNVPRNNALAAVDPQGRDADAEWSRYARVWTRWNHLRTATSMVASGLFIAALASS